MSRPGVYPQAVTAAIVSMGVLQSCGAAELLDLEPQGPIALSERSLIVTSFGLMLIVLVPVFLMTAWFAWWYRASNARATYAPDWIPPAKLEALIWFAPTVIVAALAILTWTYTHRLDPYKPLQTRGAPLQVQVVAMDWKWLFIYPRQGIATVNELVIPVGRPVSFEVTSDTVMNAFFIPQLGGQIFAMAGMRTELHLLAEKSGTYLGENTQYTGRGFPYQHFEVRAEPPQAFSTWVDKVKQSPQHLDPPRFAELERPSVRDPVMRFASVAPNLFARVIGKFTGQDKMQAP